MSSTTSSIGRRLARIEQRLAEMTPRPPKCNCVDRTVVYTHAPEQFEADMNLPCPAHGIRRLGVIFAVCYEGEDTSRFDQLLAKYKARQWDQTHDGC
jgi:hypothetical protein